MAVGSCVRRTVLAIVVHPDGRFWVGSNICLNTQKECPRQGMATLEGYDLCKSVCWQPGHAEVMACRAAGEHARGSKLYLIGHAFACDDCKAVMEEYGISEVIVGRFPEDKEVAVCF